MEKIAVENINGLIFEGKAIPLAGFSSTRGHKILGFKWFAKCSARWHQFLSVDKFAAPNSPTFHTATVSTQAETILNLIFKNN